MPFEFTGEDIAQFLSELIRIDTSNPPGNELEAAKLVAEKLREYGIESVILESEPKRGNVIARVRGREEGPTVLLLSHLDVVPAKPEEWKVHPFSGEIKNGFVWGRGALDCKGGVAVEMFTLIQLAKEEAIKGTLVFAATADEEKGGLKGVKWLLENRPDLIKADYVINEGGGFEIPVNGRSIFTVQTAEKGVYWFKLRFKGTPGHASMPSAYDNAIAKAAKAIDMITRVKPKICPTPHAKKFIESLLTAMGRGWIAKLLLSPLTADIALSRIPDRSKAAFIEALLRNTLTPTVVRGGYKENIVPSDCELTVDCRLLPGFDERWVEEYLRGVLRGIDYELSFIHKEPPTESPLDTLLFKAINKALVKQVPNVTVTPYMSPGGTDSRYFRRVGVVAYGFIPFRADVPFSELMKMVHGVNERISVKNLEFSYKTLTTVLREFYGLLSRT